MPVRCSTGRSNSAPASVVICPPSKRATTSREKLGANGKQDWVHSVIAKAAFSLVLTAVWKLSYPMKSGFLPYFGEKSGLVVIRYRSAMRNGPEQQGRNPDGGLTQMKHVRIAAM